jgi:hypothetical protein
MEFSGMHYNMEQLVKALTAETMAEISYDDAEIHEEEGVLKHHRGMWENIAKTVVEEIDSTYDGGSEIKPYGYYADEVVLAIKPLLQPYSAYPAAHHLLSALEQTALNAGNGDPRPYVTIVIRAMDTAAAKKWKENIMACR